MTKYERDYKTGAIINRDQAAYNEFVLKRELLKNKKNNTNISEIETKVNKLNNDVSEIKNMLKLLLESKN